MARPNWKPRAARLGKSPMKWAEGLSIYFPSAGRRLNMGASAPNNSSSRRKNDTLRSIDVSQRNEHDGIDGIMSLLVHTMVSFMS